MKNLGLLLLALLLSVLLGLLGTTVVLSVSSLFGLTFLAELGFVKLYGLISIFQIVNYKYKDSDAGAGNRWVTYNVKIFSEDTKGKKHLYEGYYTLHTSAPELYEEGKWPGWRIEKGEFKKIY